MNIAEIKKRSIEITEYMHYADKEEIRRQDTLYLLSIIEQAEKALNDIADSKYLTIVYARKRAEEALQAIRKGD